MNDYDIEEVFRQMELELIASMKRNLARHQKWEKDEGINWAMWQVEQLKTLENFKKENKKLFGKKFSSINAEIANFLTQTYKTSGFEQERAILEELAKGNKVNPEVKKRLNQDFFSLNTDKMNALIKATTDDMKKAETAVLRMVNDQYRKTIYKAQAMANTGAFTLDQAIDMATKDFLKAGINCIQYKDGRRVNIATYAEMAIRTANKRAKLISEGDARNVLGVHTVKVSKYGQCSETCLPWQGKVYVDDVYSGGTKEEAKKYNLPLLSEAIAGGLFHPNCKHTMTAYFYDLEKSLGNLQNEDIENPPEEQEHRKNKKHIQQQERIEKGSLDPENIAEAKARKEKWIEKDKHLGYNNEDLKEIDIPRIKIAPYGQEQTYKKYTSNEIMSFAKTNEEIIDKHISKKSKWSGKIVYEDNPEKVQYAKLWSCDIRTSHETAPHMLLHEQLHARSVSYYEPNVYNSFRKIEESSVQFLTQEISNIEDIEIIESAYDEMVDSLREINKIAKLYETDYEFAKELFVKELPDRRDWLEDLVHDKMMSIGDIGSMIKINELISKFY